MGQGPRSLLYDITGMKRNGIAQAPQWFRPAGVVCSFLWTFAFYRGPMASFSFSLSLFFLLVSFYIHSFLSQSKGSQFAYTGLTTLCFTDHKAVSLYWREVPAPRPRSRLFVLRAGEVSWSTSRNFAECIRPGVLA